MPYCWRMFEFNRRIFIGRFRDSSGSPSEECIEIHDEREARKWPKDAVKEFLGWSLGRFCPFASVTMPASLPRQHGQNHLKTPHKNFGLLNPNILLGILAWGCCCACVSCGRNNTILPQPPVDIPDSPVAPVNPDSVIEPDDGATIVGHVTSEDGKAVRDVAVSDGHIVALTNEKGEYRMKSDKSTGYVFVSIPGGYTVKTDGSVPRFYSFTTRKAGECETHDFSLVPVDDTSYAVVIHADQHLAGRTEDVAQFHEGFIPDVNGTITRYCAMGRRVYSISLGDVSWEQFWYANNFTLSDAARCFDGIDCPVFHAIGNHDNDPYISDDWRSAWLFRERLAPTYYSFNIGRVHYVILDNVVYNNPGASAGTMGDRSYDRALTRGQLDWLAEDLATLPDKSTPLVVCAHVPFYKEPTLSGQTQVTRRNMIDMEELEGLLSGFTDVTLFSGHYHRNFAVESPFIKGMRERNVASVSGSLWWTGRSGYAGNHLCTDGSPGGYGVLEVDGTQLRYHYKGIGYEPECQFRVYDLNEVVIDRNSVTNSKYKDKVVEYADAYGKSVKDNEVLINVFAWSPGWQIEVTENGNPLEVTRVRAKDPLHILSYECQRLSHGALPTTTSTLMTQYSTHFFKARASASNSSLRVTVTDEYGRRYIQTVSRPVKFHVSMR